jgi:hypothetical protein
VSKLGEDSDLAASRRPRFGTAVKLVRIIPDEYSELAQSTPSVAMASVAMPSREADAEHDGHAQRPEVRAGRSR